MKRFDWPINREGGIFGSENERYAVLGVSSLFVKSNKLTTYLFK